MPRAPATESARQGHATDREIDKVQTLAAISISAQRAPPALAEWHKPLDTKAHGGRVAALRRGDHGPNDGVPIIFEEFFRKLRDASAGAFRLTARVPGHALLETSSLILS